MYSKWLFFICVVVCAYRCSCESETISNVLLETATTKSAPDMPVGTETISTGNDHILVQSSQGKSNFEEEKSGKTVSRSNQTSEQPVDEKKKRSMETDQISDQPSERKSNLEEGKSGETTSEQPVDEKEKRSVENDESLDQSSAEKLNSEVEKSGRIVPRTYETSEQPVDEKEKRSVENDRSLDQSSAGKSNSGEGKSGETISKLNQTSEQPVDEKEKRSLKKDLILEQSSAEKLNSEVEKSGETISKLNPTSEQPVDEKEKRSLQKDQISNQSSAGKSNSGEGKSGEPTSSEKEKPKEESRVKKEDLAGKSDSTTASSSADFTTILAETARRKCVISNDTDFSWLVKIIDKDTRQQVCTGTLITDEDILVPASCFLENSTAPVADNFYDAPEQIYAIAGGGIDTDCMQIRNVTAIYPHKAYLTDVDGLHDYAYLKVKPEFDVDDDNIPDLRYHTTVLSSEGALVDIHNLGPFCESPYFVDDGINARVSEERHLMGMRIEECMSRWNCSANFDSCLDFLHPSSHGCLKSLAPRNCTAKDRGAPLICASVFVGFLDICDGELPMIFRGLNKAIKFLELEDNHVQPPGYFGVGY